MEGSLINMGLHEYPTVCSSYYYPKAPKYRQGIQTQATVPSLRIEDLLCAMGMRV